jgi:hypothetical protein
MAYPTSIDSFTPVVSGVSEIRSVDVNSLQTAIVAVENMIGPRANIRLSGSSVMNIGTSAANNLFIDASSGGYMELATSYFEWQNPAHANNEYVAIYPGGMDMYLGSYGNNALVTQEFFDSVGFRFAAINIKNYPYSGIGLMTNDGVRFMTPDGYSGGDVSYGTINSVSNRMAVSGTNGVSLIAASNGVSVNSFLTLTPSASGSVANNSFFVDSGDNLLKFRDNAGTIRTVNLT